jgi:hypothetical protein
MDVPYCLMAQRRQDRPNETPQRDEDRTKSRIENRETPTVEEIRRVMSALGKRGGLKGGEARAAKLSKRRRVEIAKEAAAIRWGKK